MIKKPRSRFSVFPGSKDVDIKKKLPIYFSDRTMHKIESRAMKFGLRRSEVVRLIVDEFFENELQSIFEQKK